MSEEGQQVVTVKMEVKTPPLDEQGPFQYVNHLTVQNVGDQVFMFWGQAPVPLNLDHAQSLAKADGTVVARPVAHLTMPADFFEEVVKVLVARRDGMRATESPGE
jgi:hypothetical protein